MATKTDDDAEREYERKCREDKFLEYAEMVAFAADVIRENRNLRAELKAARDELTAHYEALDAADDERQAYEDH